MAFTKITTDSVTWTLTYTGSWLEGGATETVGKLSIEYTVYQDYAANQSRLDGSFYFTPTGATPRITVGSGQTSITSCFYTIDGTAYTGTCSVFPNASTGSNQSLTQNKKYLLTSFSQTFTHNTDGSKTVKFGTCGVGTSSSPAILKFVSSNTGTDKSANIKATGIYNKTLPAIPKAATFLTATNFTDEENPVITYNNSAGESVDSLEACISLTGATDDIAYRSISKTAGTYTFELTDDDRNVLRMAAINAQTVSVRFYLKTTIGTNTYFEYVTRTVTIANCNPVLNNPTVKDIQPDVVALTGNENTIVRYASMAEYSFEPVAKKYATIASQYIQNGTKKITGLSQGVIDEPESGLFVFSATDSRGLTTTATVTKTFIEYIKPTCYQNLKAEMVGETGAKITLTISGDYFNGTFGAVSNTLKLEVKHTQNDGTMGDWVDLTDGLIPVFDGNTYSLEITISGFDYSQSYTFQCRATDKLNVVQSAEYTIKLLPVFDWGESDFNFNVPVNINANTLSMNDEVVLRHTGSSTNNTVLSASGGHIYIRPGGTSDTSSEVRITAQGDIEVKGDIIINGVSLTTILENAGLM